MSFTGNDGANTGQLIQNASKEAIDGRLTTPLERDRRFRDAGWWPSSGTALRVVIIAFVAIVAIGWGLTLLAK